MGGDAPKTQTTTEKQKQEGATTSDVATSGTSATQQSGTTASQEFAQAQADVPDWLKPFIYGATNTAGGALGSAGMGANAWQVPQEAISGLTQTAGGDFLYGGPGQQAFIDAAMRAALPGINSQFEMAGRPGGGLYNAQIAQQAQDAYARLYDQERNRQQQAQQLLPGISALPIQLQMQLAQLAGQLPSQFAPFLGKTAVGATAGQTSGQSATQTSGTSHETGTSSMKGTTTQTQPLYQTPWWQTALGGAAAGAGALGSLAPPSEAAAAAGGFSGGSLGGLLAFL